MGAIVADDEGAIVEDDEGAIVEPDDGEAMAVAAGDGAAVAWAIALGPMLPCDAVSGAATALSPRLATSTALRTPVLSRFKLSS
jgi:hypothetical protein